MKLRKLTYLFFLCLSLSLLEAQDMDVKALAEKDLYRGDLLLKETKAERSKVWEAVSLSLLVQEVEAAAEALGLESFSLDIANNAINIIYRDIRFLPNSSEVTPETEEKIYKLTEILKRFSNMALLVQGHTAKLSPEDTDDGLELSEGRARSVAGLISKTGLFDSEKIEAVGRGFYEPVADNATQEGRALNRRVEISIVGSVGKDLDNSMVWWELLSNSMLPGYTAYLVKNENLESVKNRLEEAGITDLIFAETSAGVGVIDNKIFYKEDGTPDSDSLQRMQKIGNILPLIQTDTEVRIGGYGSDLSIEEIEERHFLTAYNLAVIAGVKPDNITYSAAPYVLTKATAALKAGKISTSDGTPIELKGDVPSFAATVPYSVDTILIDLTTEDPHAKITGLSEDTVSLVSGNNEIFVTVESAAGEQKISQSYRLTVVREAPAATTLSKVFVKSADSSIEIRPEFSPEITSYTAVVPYSVESVSISMTPTDEEAVLETEYAEVALTIGDNKLRTTVTDQLGEHPREYNLTIERAAPLLSVLEIKPEENNKEILLVPEFSPETTDYSVTVPYKTDKLQLNAVLNDEDVAAGASVEIISEIEGELPVGTTGKVIRITYDDGKTFDYRVDITREEKDKFTFNIFGISLKPGLHITPSAAFYTAGFGFKLNGGMTVRIAEDSKVSDALKQLRIGLGGHFHAGAGNYLTILSGGGYVSTEYLLQTKSLLPDRWYIPKAIIPRLEIGAAYYAIDYTEGIYREGMSFYLSPAVRTDFIFPGLPRISFGIDFSYTVYIGPVTVTNFGLGASVSWE